MNKPHDHGDPRYAVKKSDPQTAEKYLHANVDRLGAVLARKSPLEGRRKKAVSQVRPALQMILEELGEVVGGRG